ncbi:hypothetical protein CENSYa_1253 [Cenarchaeum symbiosum A]|uniref:Uncharacterized protein n=1 Tax=Cenarchaeum symbiosum (strain A) TaxID=414004 RepID=A0RX09_CENSY|nr:hypothetical protein CENSYa_1253 [Cenarchaeum symbiosum A]
MEIKIFTGAPHVVEKSVNRFARDVKVADAKVSSYILNEKLQVTVLVLYEGKAPDHAAGPGLM